jgi:hypothetical protein
VPTGKREQTPRGMLLDHTHGSASSVTLNGSLRVNPCVEKRVPYGVGLGACFAWAGAADGVDSNLDLAFSVARQKFMVVR